MNTRSISKLNIWIAVITLLAGLLVSSFAAYYIKNDTEQEEEYQFNQQCNELKTKVINRLYTQAQILRCGVAFFGASDSVTRNNWTKFYQLSHFSNNLPGFLGIGYNQLIKKNDFNIHTLKMRRDGILYYTIHPKRLTDTAAIIVYMEPPSEQTPKTLGFDMFSNPIRKSAMEYARDSNSVSLTDKIQLVVDSGKKYSGIIMYAPIYKHNAETSNLLQRRKAIKGWVYCPNRMNFFMSDILGQWKYDIHLSIYEKGKILHENLLYESSNKDSANYTVPRVRTTTLNLNFCGKTWVLYFQKLKKPYAYTTGKATIVFIGGCCISVLLFMLVFSLLNIKRRALTIAQQLTKEIKAGRERYYSLLKTASDGIHVLDHAGNIVEANQTFADMLGYTHDEILKLNVADWDAQWPIGELINKIKELIGNPQVFETIHRRKDGKLIDVEINGVGILMNGNHYLYASARDITSRKLADKALRESEAKSSAILRAIPDMMFIQNISGEFVDFFIPENNEFSHLFNIRKGQTVDDVLDWDLSLKFKKIFKEVIELKQVRMLEFAISIKNKQHYFESRTTNYGENMVLTIIREISERKASEDLIKQTRINYETFFNSIDEFLFVLDDKGNILHANQTVYKRLGYTFDELYLQPVLNVHPKERRAEASSIIIDMLQGKVEFCPIPLVTKSGQLIPVETRVTTGFWNGSPALFGVTKDISKIMLSEEKFSKAFNNNVNIMAISDLKTRQFIDVNKTFLNTFGLTREEVIGKTTEELYILSADVKSEIAAKLFNERRLTDYELEISCNGYEIAGLLSGEIINIQDTACWFTVIQNITKLKEAEIKILNTLNIQKILLDNISAGIVILDSKSHIIENINAAGSLIFGDSAEKIIGHKCHCFLCPNQEGSCPITDLHQEIDNSERKLLTHDGTLIPILKTVKKVIIDGNEKLIETFFDITKLKLAEEALRLSNQKWEAIISASPDGIGMVDLEGALMLISNKLAQMCGYLPEEKNELIGHSFFEFIKSSDQPALKQKLLELISDKTAQQISEYIAIRKDHTLLNIDINPSVLHDDAGNPAGILFIIRDITERKKAEDSLKKSEIHLLMAMNIAHAGHWDYDVTNDLFYFNDSFYNIFHDTVKNVGSYTLSSRNYAERFVHPDDKELVTLEIIKALETSDPGYSRYIEHRFIYADGNIGYLAVRFQIEKNEIGKTTRLYGANQDITTQKKVEEDLIKSKMEADSANRAKSEFLANMSHEIRTPMNAILGFSEALYHKLTEKQYKQMVKSILNSGNLLMSLLNDILDLSKIEAGKLDIVLTPVDLSAILSEIALLFREKAISKGLELAIEIQPDFPRSIIIDEIRIKQVLFNLVGNAIKFTHKGHVSVYASFKYTGENFGQLQVNVEDTGIGIHDSQKQIIFEAFRQQAGQSNRMYGGTGLGLAISKRLVEKMQGVISVDSISGKGSTFTVLLDKVAISYVTRGSESDLSENEEIKFESSTILVTDDVATNIEAVENLLLPTTVNIITANGGEIALELLKSNHVDLILLDIRMPQIDGYEVAQRIKNDPVLKNIPVIAYTASVIGANKIEESGNFEGFLFKPVRRTELFNVLKKYLPFTIIKNDNIVNANELVDEFKQEIGEVKNLKKLIIQLDTHTIPQWEKIKDSLILFKINEFAKDIKVLGVEFNFQALIKYSDKIVESLDMVDIPSLKSNLAEFSTIVQIIKNQSHQAN
jgi:PAS domain S-box-containing protein